ncbi:hypothetical protein AMECASPLE_004588 [Ameca splendens]|uniref:Uncharacterized protein n=1 Tax=Ameca splendens TaxID=208324 RepID=A0ABV0XZ27_9TELE
MGGWINKEKHYALYNHGAVKKFLRPLQISFVFPYLSQSSISNLQANCNSDRDHLAKCKLQFSNNGFIKEKSNANQALQKVTSTLPLIPGSATIGGSYFDLGHKLMV